MVQIERTTTVPLMLHDKSLSKRGKTPDYKRVTVNINLTSVNHNDYLTSALQRKNGIHEVLFHSPCWHFRPVDASER